MGHRVGTLGHEYGSDEVVGRRSASGVCHPGVVRGGERARGGDARDSRRYRIGPDDLDDPEAVVSAWGEIVAVRGLLARLPDDAGVGIDVGRRFTLTHLGLMGFAAMSCARCANCSPLRCATSR